MNHMPSELSRLIQDLARPRTRPDWRRGSYMSRNVGFSQFYWECGDGPWYTYYHENFDCMLDFYKYGWYNSLVSGIQILRTLVENDASFSIVMALFALMSTPENITYLRNEIREQDPSMAQDATRNQLFYWLFSI